MPRHAFSLRDVARPSVVWRACQDVAVDASIAGGWPPERYRQAEIALVIREMTVVHHREAVYGERFNARTWLARTRRNLLSTRELRLENAAGPYASVTQEWVHVSAALRPQRAPADLTEAFEPVELESSVVMPAWEKAPGTREHTLEFRTWQTWMDPLGHINHPMYIDFADEAVARIIAAAGIAEERLRPVADNAVFRAGIGPEVQVRVTSRLLGRTANGACVIGHEIHTGEILCAELTTQRTLADLPPDRLAELF